MNITGLLPKGTKDKVSLAQAQFVEFVVKVLSYDPSRRPLPSQLILEPFLSVTI